MLVFNSFRLDVANASLSRGKQAILLTPKALNVLRYLVEHAGQLVSKDDLWRAVWPGISVTDATLTNCVVEVRKALGDDPKTPRYIETVHRLGYRFIAPVSTESARIGGSRVIRQDSPPAPLRSLTPHFVGREAESAQLHEWLGRALQGERQIVFVTGEPGIGKTTLVEEFLRQEQVAAGESLWIGRGQCIEHYGAGEAYLPLLDALARLCRQAGGRRLVELLDKHAPAWLVQMPGLVDAAEWKKLQGMAAGVSRETMLRQLADAVEMISQERPLVLRLEDLHWSDYSTLEWVAFLARRQEPARLLVIGTYRPVEVIVREHPLKNLKYELQIHGLCKELPLSLLNEAAVTEYLNLRFASLNSSSGEHRAASYTQEPVRKLAHTIYERTDGNPLFMVNVVDYMVEREALKNICYGASAQPAEPIAPPSIDTPPSLVQMIEHNLERLNPDEQVVLEAASVAGAEFSAAAVAAALGTAVGHTESCCTQLARRQQFLTTLNPSEWPDGTLVSAFRFQHSLYREVIYRRLPTGHRIQLHHRIAECLEIAWREHAEEIATQLAYHFTEAGLIEKAIPYWQRAGQSSVERSANAEAIRHFNKGLDLIKFTPDTPERIQQELMLQISLGQALMAMKGYAAPEVGQAYTRALDLCRQVGETPQLFSVLGGLVGFNMIRGELRTARELVEEALLFAQKLQIPSFLQAAHYGMGEILGSIGELYESRTHLERAITLGWPRKRRPRPRFYDTQVVSLATAGQTLWALGYPDQALKRVQDSLTLAQELSHPFSLAFALDCAAGIYQRRGDVEATEQHAEALIALSHEHGFILREARGVILRGWALSQRGLREEGIAQMSEAMATVQATGAELWRPYFVALLAEARAQAGQPEQDITALTEALDLVNRSGARFYEAELYRLQGEFVQKQHHPNLADAEGSFRMAIEIARRQEAKMFELRATISLVQLLVKHDRKRDSRALLADIYRWFTEGFETGDLREAKLLLDELTDN